MTWIADILDPGERAWEEFYRNRWQHDKMVRSTHGVNCTGGCSWNVFVKDGIVTWETQALDYPQLQSGIPPYEPRGCQRGITTSWYVYSPLRVKYPYCRGVLLDLWRAAKGTHADPVDAWASIVEDPVARASYQHARGKGGFRRSSWDEVLEMVAASTIYTIKQYGPDRILGFTPIPAMSMLSYAAGTRFLSLLGGTILSFYDWYADLPAAFPEVWGEQTDVAESADWYNSDYIVVMGSNLSMTRTPDVHFAAEARHHGAKLVVLSPDFSQVSKYADWWLPVIAGQDGAFWMAVDHVILKEFFVDREVPYFLDYLKRYTDCPFLVTLRPNEGPGAGGQGTEVRAQGTGQSNSGSPAPGPQDPAPVYRADRLLRANAVPRYRNEENGDWKFLVLDALSGELRMPGGTMGFRWGEEKGKWNLLHQDGADGSAISPVLSLLNSRDGVLPVQITTFGEGSTPVREVPVRYVETVDGPVAVTTVLDLLIAQMGVSRGLGGDYPESYDDPKPFTPAWQEPLTGIDRRTLIHFAREFAANAERTNGRSMIIIGTGVNQWYQSNLMYRAAMTALMLCGCEGRNGGGMNHYVGQEKVVPVSSWSTLAFALDWVRPPRQQNAPSFHYVHSDQWRYDDEFTRYHPVPPGGRYARGHAMDMQVRAVRMGWLPFYPQFNRSSIGLVQEAMAAGATTDEEVVDWVVGQLKADAETRRGPDAGTRGRGDAENPPLPEGEGRGEGTHDSSPITHHPLRFAVEDPDAPENWPRLWFIWRGNALMASAKGHEFFLKHYLGTNNNVVTDQVAEGQLHEVEPRQQAPEGKLDLVVDLNFRMDTSALYSDVVLPAATWYEKNDLNTTDLHSFVHPMGEAVPPCWESKSDWEIFKAIAKKVSELAATHLPGRMKDLVCAPLAHDSRDEIAQPEIRDWAAGECDPVPGKTMPWMSVVERDFANLYNRFVSLGHLSRDVGFTTHGIHWKAEDLYDQWISTRASVEWGGERYPSLVEVVDAANVVLFFAPETNGELAYRAFKEEEQKVGVPLADLAEPYRGVRISFSDIVAQPRRYLTSPCWSGIVNNGRPYTGFAINVERMVPWRTLTGRQQFYLDHQLYLEFGEQLPTYKGKPGPEVLNELKTSPGGSETLMVNILTPHGKWHIHSTFMDNHRMLTLNRGVEPMWLNDRDCEALGIKDNDWVEVYNDNGVVVTRAAVSARIPRGVALFYHAPERTISVPKSPVRGNRRAGTHNSLTRMRPNPVLMAGGYGQFTYAFNYWGPIGVTRDTYVYVRKLPQLLW